MSEIQTQIHALTERIAKLEQLIESQVTPRFDDVQDDHKALAERMNEYQGHVDKRVSELTEKATGQMLAHVRDAYGRVVDQFKAEVRKIASEEFFRGLTRKVLVTRTANQADLKEGVPVVVVRHATHREAATGVVSE